MKSNPSDWLLCLSCQNTAHDYYMKKGSMACADRDTKRLEKLQSQLREATKAALSQSKSKKRGHRIRSSLLLATILVLLALKFLESTATSSGILLLRSIFTQILAVVSFMTWLHFFEYYHPHATTTSLRVCVCAEIVIAHFLGWMIFSHLKAGWGLKDGLCGLSLPGFT